MPWRCRMLREPARSGVGNEVKRSCTVPLSRMCLPVDHQKGLEGPSAARSAWLRRAGRADGLGPCCLIRRGWRARRAQGGRQRRRRGTCRSCRPAQHAWLRHESRAPACLITHQRLTQGWMCGCMRGVQWQHRGSLLRSRCAVQGAGAHACIRLVSGKAPGRDACTVQEGHHAAHSPARWSPPAGARTSQRRSRATARCSCRG